MRNPRLHSALEAFATEAGALLAADIERGAELPFEVVDEGARGGPALYRYRPRSSAFIAERWARMRELDTYESAAGALEPRACAYLRYRAIEGSGADAALRDLVTRLYEDVTSFQLREDRFDRVYAELEVTVEESTVSATVIAPLHGVRVSHGRVELGDGLALVRRSAIPSPPVAAGETETRVEGDATGPSAQDGPLDERPAPAPLDVFCELARDIPVDAALPVGEARVLFRRVVTALRLCGAGGTALGALAWARAGDGAWHPVALEGRARPRPQAWELRHAEETELRELLGILAQSRHGPSVSWALDRFEMGCERGLELEALSDYLLALRALLAEPGAGEAGMALRLSALCSTGDDRRAVQRRLEQALALEREMAFGDRVTSSALALDSPRAVVREIEGYLRALLRDVLCGYLEEDLRAAADGVLLAGSPDSHDVDTEEFEPVDLEALDAPGEDRSSGGARRELVGAGVTPSTDWPLETDAGDLWEEYSAPV